VAVSIPVLIVPTLNQPDSLRKMLRSIDYSVDQIVVVDNGGMTEPELSDDPMFLAADVIHLPHNIGVSASWNLGIKVTPKIPWWLFVNDDIEFGKSDLARLEETIDPAAAGIWFMLGMAAFAITRHTLNAVGMFDENFHPAYDEDLDFARRLDLVGLPRQEVGFTGTHVGSATIMADPRLRTINGFTHGQNDRYYERKWGGTKLGGETFTTPFGRGGHMGEWQLEPERIRAQAWPRR
jgi:GT2 family glycosyltransferase